MNFPLPRQTPTHGAIKLSWSLLTFSPVSPGCRAVQVCVLFTVWSPIRAIAWSAALHASLSRIDRPVWPLIYTPTTTNDRWREQWGRHNTGEVSQDSIRGDGVQEGSSGQPATVALASSSDKIQVADCIKGPSHYSATALIWWKRAIVNAATLSPCSSAALEGLSESLWHTRML